MKLTHREVQESFCEFLNDGLSGRDLAAVEVQLDCEWIQPLFNDRIFWPPAEFGSRKTCTCLADVLRLQLDYRTEAPRITIYEVKVERSDFLSDVRTASYGDLCRRCYPKLIEEIHKES